MLNFRRLSPRTFRYGYEYSPGKGIDVSVRYDTETKIVSAHVGPVDIDRSTPGVEWRKFQAYTGFKKTLATFPRKNEKRFVAIAESLDVAASSAARLYADALANGAGDVVAAGTAMAYLLRNLP